MALTAEKMIATAEKYAGYSEHDDGGRTPFGVWYAKRVKDKAFEKAAWCDMFLSYCGWEAGGEEGLSTIGLFAYTPHHASWFARNGRWGSTATRGALGFIDWAGSKQIAAIDHVALVLGTDSKGRISTIEGNTADQVAYRKRDRSLFVGFGYPRYGKVPTSKNASVKAPPKASKPATGSTAPKFPLAQTDYFSTAHRNGYTNKKDSDGVRRFQARLKQRGWRIDVDGRFGPQTDRVVRAFQAEKGLVVDGKVGRLTWAAIWNAPIT